MSSSIPTAASESSSSNMHPTIGSDGDMSEIQPGLFVGNARAASDPTFLASNHISHVMNCTARPSAPGWKADRYLQLDLEDAPASPSDFRVAKTPLTPAVLHGAVLFIDRALAAESGGVLVHCEMGASRSVAVACAYFMSRDPSLRPREAQLRISVRRTVADVNRWFQDDLVQFRLLLVTWYEEDPFLEIERSAARRCLPGAPAHALACRMGEDVADRIDDALEEVEAAALYASMGYDDRGVMGAVGRDPGAVRAALREGTLHERTAHLLSLFDIVASPTRSDLRDRLRLGGADGGDWSALPRRLVRAKEEAVLEHARRDDPALVNVLSAAALGLEVSPRQRAFWGREGVVADPVPPFRRHRRGTRLSSPEERSAAFRPQDGWRGAEFCGPSSHAFRLIRLGQALGYDPKEVSELAEVYLASVGAHTRDEVDVALSCCHAEELR